MPLYIAAAPSASPTFTGVVTLPAGSAAAPGLVFPTSPTTGWFDRGGNWAYAVGGLQYFDLNDSASSGVVIRSTIPLGFSTNPNTTAPDSFLSRTAPLVLRTTDAAGASATWLQQTPGEGVLNAAFTRADATLTNTALSYTVIAGRNYRIHGVLQASNTTATEGIKFDFAGGTATATTFFMSANAIGSVVAGTVTSTALSTALNYTTLTGTDYIILEGYLKVNAAGTLILRAAENTTAAGTVTIGAGSFIALDDSVGL